MKIISHIDKFDFLSDADIIQVEGWVVAQNNEEIKINVFINGKLMPYTIKRKARKDVSKIYADFTKDKVPGFIINIEYPKEEKINTVRIEALAGNKRHIILNKNEKNIQEFLDSQIFKYHIDNLEKRTNGDSVQYIITGWAAVYGKQSEINIKLINQKTGREIPFEKEELERADLINAGIVTEEQKTSGFRILYDWETDFHPVLCIGAPNYHVQYQEDLENYVKRNRRAYRKILFRQILKNAKFGNLKKVLKYIRKNGFKGLKTAILNGMTEEKGNHYHEWFERHKVTEEQLMEQKTHKFDYEPKISILVPTYNTPIKLLREMIDSVRNQSYQNWELCIADGSEGNEQLEQILFEYNKLDQRILVNILEKNEGIAGNTNGALKIATGDYIGLLDHDDLLTPDALYEVVKVLQDEKTDIVYTDEDKVSDDLSLHLDPNFKPDFSIDLFRSHNYITHFFVVRKSIVDEIGGFHSEYDGSQDYDLMFRCIEKASVIKHIPKILYHWRICVGSVAENPASKMYAYEAGRKAIEDHLKRVGIKATVKLHEDKDLWGMYHVIYDTGNNPLVSIIIPNKDHISDLEKCIKSIIKKSKYKNYEIIVVENNSTEDKTFAYYKKLQEEYNNIKVVVWEGVFNYSVINNFGVSHASGEYLLLLNNDTELISPNGIGEMLGICMREDVGVVGAKLYFEDNTVQHAGIVIGFGGFAGHVFSGIGKKDYGYMVRARINCNYSAVTAACLMTKKSVWEEVNGLTEEFVVALNDVDYCLKVREKNYLVVYNAFSEWYHYESKSRGYEDTPEKKARFASEVKKFQTKWSRILEEGDPYYNINFPVTIAPFTLD